MQYATHFLTAFFALLFMVPSGLHAQDMHIEAPGASVHMGRDGVSVVAPGANVQTGGAATSVQTYSAPSRYVPADSGSDIVDSGQSFSNAILDGQDFSGQNLARADFGNASLKGVNFANADLRGATFGNAILDGANLSSARADGASFGNASLQHANLAYASMRNADFGNAILTGACIYKTDMTGAMMGNADLSGAIRAPCHPPVTSAATISRQLQAPVPPGQQQKIDLTVNFDFDSDRLTPEGERQVREIADALNDPSLSSNHIRVEGHTDYKGSDAYNQRLSERRARRVEDTLVNAYNVSGQRLSAQGFGETQPIASNESDIGRAKNRRVTLVNLGR